MKAKPEEPMTKLALTALTISLVEDAEHIEKLVAILDEMIVGGAPVTFRRCRIVLPKKRFRAAV